MIVFFAIFSDAIFINHFLASLLETKHMDIVTISIILSVKRFAKIIFDIPIGLLASKIGLKKVLILSRLLKLASVCLLFCSGKFCLITSMILYGMAHVAFYGKFEVYMYNYLADTKNISVIFRKITGFCYGAQDFLAFVVSLIGFRIFTITNSYNILIALSIIILLTFIMVAIYMPNTDNINLLTHKKLVFKKINATIIKHILFLSILIALAFSITDIFQIGLVNIKESPANIAIISGMSSLAMFFGCILPLFSSKYINKTKQITQVLLLILLATSLSILIFGINLYTSLFLIPYFLIFPTMEILFEFKLDVLSKIELRALVSSLSTTCSTILGGVFGAFVASLSSYISFSAAFSMLLAIICSTLLFLHRNIALSKNSISQN